MTGPCPARAMTGSGDARRVLVYVGGSDIEGSQTRSAEMVRTIGQAGATPMIVLITGGAFASSAVGGPTSGSSFPTDIQGYFEQVAAGYRGSCAVVLSTQAALKALQDVGADLEAGYQTIFTRAACRGVLDEPAARPARYVDRVLDAEPLVGLEAADRRDLIRRNCRTLLVGAVAEQPQRFSRRF